MSMFAGLQGFKPLARHGVLPDCVKNTCNTLPHGAESCYHKPMRNHHRLARRRPRRIMKRRLAVLVAAALMPFALLWGVCQAWPKNTWLSLPDSFYQPEKLPVSLPKAERALAPLPLEATVPSLGHKIDAILAKYPKTLQAHVFYVHPQRREFYDLNGDTPVPAASVIKLPILYTMMQHIEQGQLSESTPVRYEEFERASGSGDLQFKDPGVSMRALDVATRMIQSSDNTCTNMLIYQLGGAKTLNQRFLEMGLTHTHVSNWLPDLEGSNAISMRDMATVLYNLTRQDSDLSPSTRFEALQILEGTHNRRLIPALLPPNTVVAHKTGDIGASLGNSAIVYLPNGQYYILAIQVQRPRNNYAAKTLIQEVSKVVYDDVVGRSSKV